jgi:hypothetical protein
VRSFFAARAEVEDSRNLVREVRASIPDTGDDQDEKYPDIDNGRGGVIDDIVGRASR